MLDEEKLRHLTILGGQDMEYDNDNDPESYVYNKRVLINITKPGPSQPSSQSSTVTSGLFDMQQRVTVYYLAFCVIVR